MRRTAVVLALLAILPWMGTPLVPAATAASPPVHEVKGSGTFWLEVGVPNEPFGELLVEHVSVNAWLDDDGSAHGFIQTVTNWIIPHPPKGQPDPFGTGGQALFAVTGLVVTGNVASIETVVVFSPDFPDEVGNYYIWDVVDVGGPPNSGDLVYFAGFGPLVTLAGNYIVR